MQKCRDLCLGDLRHLVKGHRVGAAPVPPSNARAGWMQAINNGLLNDAKYFDFFLSALDHSFPGLPNRRTVKHGKKRRSGTTPYECAGSEVLLRLRYDLKGDLRNIDIQVHAEQITQQHTRVERVFSYVQEQLARFAVLPTRRQRGLGPSSDA